VNRLALKLSPEGSSFVLYPEMISQIQNPLKIQYVIQQQTAQKVKC
jgi:hypothetical protein